MSELLNVIESIVRLLGAVFRTSRLSDGEMTALQAFATGHAPEYRELVRAELERKCYGRRFSADERRYLQAQDAPDDVARWLASADQSVIAEVIASAIDDGSGTPLKPRSKWTVLGQVASGAMVLLGAFGLVIAGLGYLLAWEHNVPLTHLDSVKLGFIVVTYSGFFLAGAYVWRLSSSNAGLRAYASRKLADRVKTMS